jgi:hypothetical protein
MECSDIRYSVNTMRSEKGDKPHPACYPAGKQEIAMRLQKGELLDGLRVALIGGTVSVVLSVVLARAALFVLRALGVP